MVLEAVMICVDNSDYTRNGDYTPTRFESQTDALNLVCGAKTQQNPENSVGVLTCAGDRIDVKITPTSDLGRIVSELAKLSIGGSADLLRGIQTAQLALKHRQNKNQKQRIIAFVGSPVTATEKELETLGKNLKKNNVSLDLVSFGEVTENQPKLEKLIGAVNSNESSNLVEVPVGPKLLSDVLLSSKIVNPDGDGTGTGMGGGDGFDFAADDPELALALRISMEEERARQQAAGGGAPAEGGEAPAADAAAAPAAGAAPAAAPAAAGGMPTASDAAVMEALGMEDIDDDLRQALLLSVQVMEPSADAAPAADASKPDEAKPAGQDVSMGSADAPKEGEGEPKDEMAGTVDSRWFQDPNFVQELLGDLPGVDINDSRIQNALKEVAKPEDKDKKDGGGGGGSGSGGDGKDLS